VRFLTGASGFLGSRLCAELLRRTADDVVCLVRAGSAAAAEARVRDRLAEQAPDVCRSPRLHCVAGDFEKPWFGLAQPDFRRLAENVREVYHCGASVNMGAPYAELAPVNIGGTRHVLEFCAAGGVERLHYVSTLGVFLGGRRAGVDQVAEDLLPTPDTCSEIGYPRSKFEAEELIRAAPHVAARIYRPGLVLADSVTGACPNDDFTARLVAAMAVTGLFPGTAGKIPVIAVDHAAQAIAALSLAPEGDGATYPLMRPEPFPALEFFDQAYRFGYRINITDVPGWRHALKSKGRNRATLAIRALGITRYLLGLDEETCLPGYSCARTTRLAADFGVRPPSMDSGYFDRMFMHLINNGTISPFNAKARIS
jgi:thioester reductase-like protein